jgi:hypothetical protein
MFRCVRKQRGFTTHNRGVTSIEFALLALPLFLLVMGTLETGLVVYCKIVLEGATTSTGRKAKVGEDGSDELARLASIRAEVRRLAGGLMDPDRIEFRMKQLGTVDDGEDHPGSGGDLVVITASYPWRIFTPLMGEIFGNPFMIEASATFRNEPFDD